MSAFFRLYKRQWKIERWHLAWSKYFTFVFTWFLPRLEFVLIISCLQKCIKCTDPCLHKLTELNAHNLKATVTSNGVLILPFTPLYWCFQTTHQSCPLFFFLSLWLKWNGFFCHCLSSRFQKTKYWKLNSKHRSCYKS